MNSWRKDGIKILFNFFFHYNEGIKSDIFLFFDWIFVWIYISLWRNDGFCLKLSTSRTSAKSKLWRKFWTTELDPMPKLSNRFRSGPMDLGIGRRRCRKIAAMELLLFQVNNVNLIVNHCVILFFLHSPNDIGSLKFFHDFVNSCLKTLYTIIENEQYSSFFPIKTSFLPCEPNANIRNNLLFAL